MSRHLSISMLFLMSIVVLFVWLFTSGEVEEEAYETRVAVSEGTVEVRDYANDEKQLLHAGDRVFADDEHVVLEKSPGSSYLVLATTSTIESSTAEPREQMDTIPNHSSTSSATSEIPSVTAEEYHIAGYTYSEAGEPIANTKVNANLTIDDLENLPQGQAPSWQKFSAVSDEKGYYFISLPHEGQVWMKTEPPAPYLSESAKVVLSSQNPSVIQNFTHTSSEIVIQGKVIEKDTRKPIAGARVTFIGSGKSGNHSWHDAWPATTGEDGTFIVKHVREGSYNVEVQADGYITYRSRENVNEIDPLRDIQIRHDSFPKEMEIKMEPGYSATIRVLDPNREPVAAADVSLEVKDVYMSHWMGKTKENGEITFEAIPKQPIVARAKKEPYGETLSEMFMPDSLEKSSVIEIVLNEPAIISGRVTNSNGEPIINRRLSADYLEREKRLGGYGGGNFRVLIVHNTVRTDETGFYEFNQLGEGSYRIKLMSEDNQGQGLYELKTQELAVKSGENRTGIDFVIEEGEGEVRGVVLDTSGNPIANANVDVYVLDPINRREVRGNGKSNEQGEFHIQGLVEADQFTLIAYAPDYAFARQVHAMSDERITVTLQKLGFIKGYVVDKISRLPIEGAMVIPEWVTTGRSITGRSNRDGYFEIENIPPGDYTMAAWSDDYAYAKGPQVTVDEKAVADDVVIELEKGITLQGIVLDSQNVPVNGAKMELYTLQHLSTDNPITVLSPQVVHSREDGSFRFEQIHPQGAQIKVTHPHYASQLVRVNAQDLNSTLVIRMQTGASIEGTILDKNGMPYKDANIVAVTVPVRYHREVVKSDENGRFSFTHFPAGAYQVSINTFQSIEPVIREGVVKEGETAQIQYP